ncbi:MAG: pyridoxamine 5'-phosphate oxidase family protein [Desulfohalobiaceae bacterium]|nr:pyridoxamine 5'-phosphate oxidase family protein [Desulfohalobiaceae bacterium]
MQEEIKSLLRDSRHCVLATAADNQPYCSLMVYTVNADCTRIFMCTRRDTRKYRNLEENPCVSLLIDSRDQPQPRALTVEGVFEPFAGDPEKQQIREKMITKHPELRTLLDSPDAELICIRVQSVLFLNGLTDARREQIE